MPIKRRYIRRDAVSGYYHLHQTTKVLRKNVEQVMKSWPQTYPGPACDLCVHAGPGSAAAPTTA